MGWYASQNSIDFAINLERIYHPMKGNWVSRFDFFTDDLLIDLKVKTAISIANEEYGILYVGVISKISSDAIKTYIVATGRPMQASPPIATKTQYKGQTQKQLIQNSFNAYQLDPQQQTYALEIARELAVKGYVLTTRGIVKNGQTTDWINFNSEKIQELSTRTKNFMEDYGQSLILGVNQDPRNFDVRWKSLSLGSAIMKIGEIWSMTSTSSVVIGGSSTTFDTVTYDKKALKTGENYSIVPLESFEMYSNISAIEYNKDQVIIWK